MNPSWRSHDDRPIAVPGVPGADEQAFYVPIGDFQGGEYRRNAFAAGTAEEVASLTSVLDLRAGTRVLDVGCGDARHLRALAAEPGVDGVGIDVSPALVDAAREAARDAGIGVDVRVGDARTLSADLGAEAGTFDVAWSLCQGGFGTSPATDPDVLAGLAAAVHPGGLVALTLFHALFAARHLAPGDAFDPVHLVHHQVSEVHGPDHQRRRFDLWTASYTVRDAVRLLDAAGLDLVSVRGVEPGGYGRRADGEVGLDDPELLVVARRL
ncbi:SAM-dependent methyltransferase [Nitriliruptor alkaliphilus]|uniref:SAM-dependent methyltransferase n=1 Tax=Nitriliruptor alkaliphilus TaxID=427918 RepID=UPI000695ADD1|nr:class I SAM-dependent methyltransferase [Nitriliruptor alkaliphilus]